MRASMYRFVLCLACACPLAARGQGVHTRAGTPKPAGPAATGPVVVFDTNRGRMTCRLFADEKPHTVALFTGLAQGKTPWMDAKTNATVQGRPMYDATVMYGISSGAAGGRRLNVMPGTGVQSLQPESSATLKFDKPGRLAMRITGGQIDARSFYILDHAEERAPEVSAGIFGQCDAASVEVVETISHELLSVDNHPKTPVVLDRVSVLQPGDPLPPPSPDAPLAAVDGVEMTIPPVQAIAAPEPMGPKVRIDTTAGTISCRLFQQTPIGTENFVGLATGTKPFTNPATKQVVRGKKFYDGLAFGRVVPDFMIQNADLPGDPGGGDTIGFHFDNEIVPGLEFDRPGRLAYANSGPNTNESEFFITESPIARLNGSYTIFGQCDEASLPVVAAIARSPRNADDHAYKPVVIRRITVQ